MSNILTAGIAAAILGLGAISATSYAQNSEAGPPSGMHGADAALANRVKQALHSNGTLDSRHVDVAVENGDVVLNGFVQDNRELLVANQVASKAAGNHKIVNHLSIKQNYPNAP
ncbi:MAG TPA: BON domain-containing protein [Steroidobacteraceae bacterium]|jgi:osmotically-inducible protein OsmY|nr:BON domain-containing protein [Steroidobacteraceae bacterium]